MKKNILSLILLLLAVVACKKSDKKPVAVDIAFSTYVQAFTSGVISNQSIISVYLSQPVERKKDYQELFHFSPEIPGKTVLVGDRIVEFRPSEPMKSGTAYKADFALGKILQVDKKLEVMPFGFSTIESTFSVTVEGLRNYEGDHAGQMQLTGYVLTSDFVDAEKVEGILTTEYDGRELPVSWTHDSNGQKHFFMVDSIAREKEEASAVLVKWDGKSMGIDESGRRELEVPALNAFKVLDASVVQQPEQCVQVRFSDPLLKTQDLTGLVMLENTEGMNFEINGNLLTIWISQRLSGKLKLTISEGIKSNSYYRLQEGREFLLPFTNAEPQVRLVGKGVIVPQDKSLEFPFEAISLKAVDVRIIQVFKQNVARFLQENKLDGKSALKRVGRLVYNGKVDLHASTPVNYNKWNTFKVDLAKLIRIEQGAIYHVEIRFCKEYSLYNCGQKEVEDAEPVTTNVVAASSSEAEKYQTEWDRPGWYESYYYPPGYRWKERNNPCDVSYYNHDRFIDRNIFASQLGIIAKEEQEHRMLFAVSNLLTTAVEPGVQLQLYNYQNQLIESIETDANGFAAVDLKKKPFLLVAQKGNQMGYLRLDDGTSLSVSNFNVSGQEIANGMKGFIYGERDVWRPGDTLFLNFILETTALEKEEHPVIFQLFNPKNQLVERRTVVNNENGFYKLTTTTKKNALTGNWRAELKVGNSLFSKRLKIEAIKPNRLKIDLDLPADKVISSENKHLPIAASWLHGSPAKSMKAKVEVMLAKTQTKFEDYPNYIFVDPASRFAPDEQTIFEGQLDENGKSSIPLNFEGLDNAPGLLNAWFTSRVFESGGDFSTSIVKAKYSPYRSYVGLRMPESDDNWYKTDQDYYPQFVVVDKNGNPVSGDDLEVRLYKIDWRWWWESGSENLAHYVSGSYYRPVAKWICNNVKQKTKIKLNVKYRNWEDNGRYLLWVKNKTSGHASGITFYMSEWGGWRAEGSGEGATMLAVRTDKQKYNVGDDIQVVIPSSKKGRALVSLENGTGVLDMFWVETTEKQTRFTLKAKPEMSPNFYVNVSLIQPYGNAENDAPIRLYGIVPVFVENAETILTPVVQTPDEIEPETSYSVEISEKNNKGMTYTLAIVDEGLLGLTNYKTPNPHAAFYRREALGVKTWDLYDFVAGAYGARLEKAFAVGGDGEMAAAEKKEANRFKPVVQFAGPFTLNSGQKQKHEFKMPNYVGAVRVMVVAGNQGVYGKTEKSVPVRKGLMLLATVPRVLAPFETFDLPVDVFAMKENVKEVSISVVPNDLFEVVGSKTNQLHFSKNGEKMSYFRLKVKGNTGVGKIKVRAGSGTEKASYEAEVQVRNPNLKVTRQQGQLVKGGESWKTELKCPGEEQSNEAWVEISGFPPLNLAKYLDFLIRYPHGCVEQTTSAVFPQLFLEKLTDLTPEQKLSIETNVRQALSRLQAFQLGSGGFSYWPGSSYVNAWAANYVGHFLICAENAGYSLPYGMKDKWIRYQKSEARNWKGTKYFAHYSSLRTYDYTQAYRLYTLALAGKPDIGAMNRLREKGSKVPQVTWTLAAAYVLAGKKEAARQVVSGVTREVKAYNEFSGTFGSSLRDKAVLLESLVLLGDQENAFAMLQNISEEMNKREWLSTQTAAWCLFAAARFADKLYSDKGQIQFELYTNGENTMLSTKVPVVKIPVKELKGKKVDINFSNRGKNAAFVRVLTSGVPAGVDSTAFEKNIGLNVKYIDVAGKRLSPASIPQGTDFRMEVTVKHPGRKAKYEEVALTTLFPSGWEILNKRLGDIAQDNSNFEYQDIRDDRVYTYFDLPVNAQKTFVFYLNAAYKGTFYYPPVACEAMYDNSVSAKQAGKMIKVE